MNRFLKSALLLMIGFSLGWLGREYFLTRSPIKIASISSENTAKTTVSFDESQSASSPAQLSNSSISNGHLSIADQNGELPKSFQEDRRESIQVDPVRWMEQLLNSRDYAQAVEWFGQYSDQYPEMKGQLLGHIDGLLSQRRDNDFSNLTNQFLASYYDDIDVLLKVALFNDQNSFYTEAVDVYQLASTYSYQDSDTQKILNSLNRFVLRVDEFYQRQNDYDNLINFYEYIDRAGLLSPAYEYQLALIYLQVDNSLLAKQHLENLLNDRQFSEKVNSLLAQLNEEDTVVQPPVASALQANDVVKLKNRGNQFIVDVTINEADNVALLIDTGASITTLTENAFSHLISRQDAQWLARRFFNTANGTSPGDIYRVDNIQLGRYLLKDIEIAVLNFSMPDDVAGLLGMNVLGRVRFQIDQSANQLLLSDK